ncbi:hypothetical protein SJA_C1-03760 [Sphingobium indicum UT26S]|uniref:Uncharacterized protein n=1 Tax=Sphingobium indicum (strain DSM 16413 / CCM 7287 / MTCC 6362 / UT26 / NBRC 101211 / UT26S) TaxID=452662 RepID=D4YXX8_SPHIU|nr:hypothetical protein SJA_C1-03760 [Sphingobium indicum UT26S]
MPKTASLTTFFDLFAPTIFRRSLHLIATIFFLVMPSSMRGPPGKPVTLPRHSEGNFVSQVLTVRRAIPADSKGQSRQRMQENFQLS